MRNQQKLTQQEKQEYFIKIFKQAQKRYQQKTIRLAAEGWKEPWQTLIATILSAQTRDETTIPVAEKLFQRFPSLEELAKASVKEIAAIIKPLNYYKTKAKHCKATARMLREKYQGTVPKTIEELTQLPGVGRKTANLILGEIYKKPAICVDTHVHRISNVLGFVTTKTPQETEEALQQIAPKKYWRKINRIFVLWGKEVKGYNPEAFLEKIYGKNKSKKGGLVRNNN